MIMVSNFNEFKNSWNCKHFLSVPSCSSSSWGDNCTSSYFLKRERGAAKVNSNEIISSPFQIVLSYKTDSNGHDKTVPVQLLVFLYFSRSGTFSSFRKFSSLNLYMPSRGKVLAKILRAVNRIPQLFGEHQHAFVSSFTCTFQFSNRPCHHASYNNKNSFFYGGIKNRRSCTVLVSTKVL